MQRRDTVPAATSAVLALALAATACGAHGPGGGADELRLGYFPNLTHAPALVGVEDGTLDEALGEDVDLQTQIFNSGPDAVNALFSGEIDAAFLGPNPAVNGWHQSEGRALHIVSGAATQGTGLVVREDIETVEDLPGSTLATPQLGGTQDVALRWFAEEQGWDVDTAGGGAVSVMPRENPETLDAYRNGDIDGAWLPEPHLSTLLEEDDSHLLVHEPDLWPETDGQYVTTNLAVGSQYLRRHPDNVQGLLRGHTETVDGINDDPEQAGETANTHIEGISGGRLDDELVAAAIDNITFTVDPAAPSLSTGAERAAAIDLLDPVDLNGIYALDPLNGVLAEKDREPVDGLEG
ncbi:ABC transporter substrate-binding protein [Nocardiopsis xinjiangensis]|uniref:ABC transporter substrate-binding protein n=1 Tax=Nocardiopsis xinjiangensis TaxID=124285 RepID=UPI0003610F0D|nr:ABC transporter substrate-binding protein [Nocardiopsis xinjiangensis]